MTGTRRTAAIVGMLLTLSALMMTALVACGGNDSPTQPTGGYGLSPESAADQQGPSGPAGAAGSSFSAGGRAPAATVTAAGPTPAPALPGRDAEEALLLYSSSGYGMSQEQYERLIAAGGDPARAEELARIQGDFDKLADDADSQQAFDYRVAYVAEDRIIVRTVDMSIEVTSVTSALSDIGAIATSIGGWVVSSNQQQARDGFITLRVPAADLDNALQQIRSVASKITAEVATSQDFTEEFTDSSARVETLTRNLESLRDLFDQATTVEESIAVRSEITKVEADLDALQARLSFLGQSSAYSLVKIQMTARPADVIVLGGDDLVIAEGRPHNFQARFTPPEGIDDYVVTWNFGDGSNERTTDRVAPTTVEGEFITSPVGHIYESEDSSPFIVTVEIRGTGQGGVIEGKDTLVATVQRIPAIEVYAGEGLTVDEGEEVQFRGTFTRPEGITGLRAEWNFGDGSAVVVTDLDEGVTAAETTHAYANFRPQAFTTTLKVYGSSPAGQAEGSDQLNVQVRQPERLSVSGFDAGGTSRSATQALASIGSGLATFGIWLAILSPVWLVGLAALYFGRGRLRRMRG